MEKQLDRKMDVAVEGGAEAGDIITLEPVGSSDDLSTQCANCFENLDRCIKALDMARSVDYFSTKIMLKQFEDIVRERRLRLSIWMSDCGVQDGGLSKLDRQNDELLVKSLASLFGRLHSASKSMLDTTRSVEVLAKQTLINTHDSHLQGRISEQRGHLERACDDLASSLHDLAKLQNSVRMALAVRGEGPEATLYQNIKAVQADLPPDDTTVSSTADDRASQRSSYDQCHLCGSSVPVFALPIHQDSCPEPEPAASTAESAPPTYKPPKTLFDNIRSKLQSTLPLAVTGAASPKPSKPNTMTSESSRTRSLAFNTGEAISERPGSLDSPNSPSSYRPHRPPRQGREEQYIAIGIDFGTAYSGVSWAYSATPNDIHHVAHWPFDGHRGKGEVQIPTQIDLNTKHWGYLVSKDDSPVRWFKLLLLEKRDLMRDMKDPNTPLEESRKKLQNHSESEPNAVIELVAGFLRKLWEHTFAEIRYEIDIDLLPIKVAITVPAIWPLYARNKIVAAAKKAGITEPRGMGKTELILVEEPEAAAIATLFDRKDYPEIEVGESFIVCDCGGGTVDITSYTVTSVNPFIVKEAVKGDGKLCGAFLIDDAFRNWMNFKSGLKFEKCERGDVRDFVNEEWEHGIKRVFTGKETSISIRPPARAFGVIKRIMGATNNLQVSSEVVKQFYARTYRGIRELIKEQKEQIQKVTGKQPKKILLVGGLGSSRYLYSMLQEQHQNVLQPLHAWSAVSRGAVMAVLKNAYNPTGASLVDGSNIIVNWTLRAMPHVSSRIARVSYGTYFSKPVEDVWPPLDATTEQPFVDKEGVKRIQRAEWYLKKGESVQDRDPIVHTFSNDFSGPDDRNIMLTIYTSEADSPPIAWPNPLIQKLCNIECKVDIPWASMREMRDPSGNLLRCREAKGLALSMSFGGAPKWTLKAGGQTKEQEVDVNYV